MKLYISKKRQKGFSLVLTLLFSTLLFMMAGGYVYRVTSNNKNVIKQKNYLAAKVLVNQGAENTIDYLNRLNTVGTENPVSGITTVALLDSTLGNVSTFSSKFTESFTVGASTQSQLSPLGKDLKVKSVFSSNTTDFPELTSGTKMLLFESSIPGQTNKGQFAVGIEPISTTDITMNGKNYQMLKLVVKSYIPNKDSAIETKKVIVTLRREYTDSASSSLSTAIMSDSSLTIPNGYTVDSGTQFNISDFASGDTVEGGIFSNGSVTIANGGQNDVDGNVQAYGTVGGNTSVVAGTNQGGQAQRPMPPVTCPTDICGTDPPPLIKDVGPSWSPCTPVTTGGLTGAAKTANGGNATRIVISGPCKISGDYNQASGTTVVLAGPVYVGGNWHDENSTAIVMPGSPNSMIYSRGEIHTKGAWPTTGTVGGTPAFNTSNYDSAANTDRNRMMFYCDGGELTINANYPNNWPSDSGNPGGGSPNKNLVEGLFYMNSPGNEFKLLAGNLKLLGGFILKPEAGHSNFTGGNNIILRDKGATWNFLSPTASTPKIKDVNLIIGFWKEQQT